MEEYVVEMRDVVKSFYGSTVLHHVNIGLRAGEVHAIVGENGAGKSTLIKIMTGVYTKDSGQILVNGKEVTLNNARDGRNLSISCIHQELCLVDELSIAQNIYLGLEDTTAGVFLNERSIRTKTQALLDEMGLHLKANQKVGTLTVAQKQMVEICRALVLNANVIIMDEPTASLTDREVKSLFVQIEKLKKQNKAIVYISHRLDEVMYIADTVSVLRDGRLIETRPADNITQAEMVRMMVGREVQNLFGEAAERARSDEIVLEVRGLRNPYLKDVSFQLRKGEILGFAGLVGAGRTEMARAIFGIDRLEAGEIWISGKKVHIRSPRDAIAHKIALVPEDRKKQGLVLSRDVAYNLTLTVMKEFIHGIRRDRKKEAAHLWQSAAKTFSVSACLTKHCPERDGTRSSAFGSCEKVFQTASLRLQRRGYRANFRMIMPMQAKPIFCAVMTYTAKHCFAATGISTQTLIMQTPFRLSPRFRTRR